MSVLLSSIGWAVILWFLALFIHLPTWVWVVGWLVLTIGMAAAEGQKEIDEKEAKTLKKCRSCAEDIKIDALKCKHCGELQA